MILVDYSVWIDYFRGGVESLKLQNLIDLNLVATNDIVLSELIPVLNRNDKSTAEILRLFPKKNLKIFWEGIRVLQSINIQNGLNKVGIPDLIIAQQCLAENYELWSLDKHFKIMAEFTELKMFKVSIL